MKEVTALVTLYNPSLVVRRNVVLLARQVGRVILIDNSTIDSSLMFSDLENVIYCKMVDNLGLSMGFNWALRNFDFLAEDFLIFFDQDSTIAEDLIFGLVSVFNSVKDIVKLGCVGPTIHDQVSSSFVNSTSQDFISTGVVKVQNVITSGMLTTYGCLKEIDFWNERIFLDFADWDLCWRMIEKGYVIVQSTDYILNHSLGHGILKISGRTIRVNSTFRIYYVVRDGLKMLISRHVPVNYRILFLFKVFVAPFVQILVLSGRYKRMQATLFGYYHFCLSKSTKYPY